MSRRHFVILAAVAGADAWLAPRSLLGQELTIVERIRRAAATGPMSVQRLRGTLSAIIGSGGNIVACPAQTVRSWSIAASSDPSDCRCVGCCAASELAQ